MSDDLDELKRLLQQDAHITPPVEAKESAIFQALAAFDEKNSKTRQGTPSFMRPIHAARAALDNAMRRMDMKKTYAVAGGVCVASLTIALLNTSYLSDMMHEMGTQKEPLATPAPSRPVEADALKPQYSAEKKMDAPAVSAAPLAAYAPPPPPAPPPPAAPPVSSLPELRASKPAPMQAAKEESVRTRKDGAMGAASAGALSKQKALASPSSYAEAVASIPPGLSPLDLTRNYYHDEGRDKFEQITENPTKRVADEPVSTFSVDVDTSSYSFVRASLNRDALPAKDAVRIEEMINYFPYNYAVPESREQPFKASVSVMPAPWNAQHKLVHVGIKGYELKREARPHANLVFLIDTSGSMNEPNKLPLLQNSLKLLLSSLQPEDSIAIVTYAGNAGTALEPTKVRDKQKILSVLDNLSAGGSTAGAEGIRQAYALAKQKYDKEGVNRVILATDGDFNVGITDPNALKTYIEHERESGVTLSILGFGMGNYNDALMQTLAQNGNGNAAYIDNLNEARKTLVEEAGSTLFTIAKDVKLQIEFNPAKVTEYRLIGYETRLLKREDFNNDKVDAGDIGAGHAVTAIYEITPVGAPPSVDDLRYAETKPAPAPKSDSGEYAFLKIRYKLPEGTASKLITTPIDAKLESASVEKAPQEARFAVAVAAFGQLLKGEQYTGNYRYDDVIALAQSAKGEDPFGYRAEFINLVRLAKDLSPAQ